MSGPGTSEEETAVLVRTLDRLEAQGYVSLDDLRAAGIQDPVLAAAAESGLLLVDLRHRLVGGRVTPVTLCRLNRRHDLVRRLLD